MDARCGDGDVGDGPQLTIRTTVLTAQNAIKRSRTRMVMLIEIGMGDPVYAVIA
jgi:hypothetical protein